MKLTTNVENGHILFTDGLGAGDRAKARPHERTPRQNFRLGQSVSHRRLLPIESHSKSRDSLYSYA